MVDQGQGATRRAVEAVWRIESARLLGGLMRMVRSVDLAEDLAQEALLSALERWPETGIPENPGAWLMTAAKNRAIDRARRRQLRDRNEKAIAQSVAQVDWADPSRAAEAAAVIETALDENVGDDLLRLILVACHPILSTDARVALTLRLLGGLSTEDIARAFLLPEPTIAQRIVRAKRSLTAAKVPFEVPRGSDLTERIPSVLEVIYLIFNEGYAASRGDCWMRTELCDDALRLGRILAELVPDQSEVHGLVSLMELHASRSRARVAPNGDAITLLEQDRSRWDRLLIRRGLAALERAELLGRPLGAYTLQAAISACHAQANRPDETDWLRIVALYDALAQVTGSPVVELNRAVAVAMAFGPDEALAIVDALADEPSLRRYHLLFAVRGDLLDKAGRGEEARAEFERAAAMTENAKERAVLLKRAAASTREPSPKG